MLRAAARLTLLSLLLLSPAAGAQDLTNFETVPVRPLALSPDGSTLFALDTPDDRLEIFDVTVGGLVHRESLTTGLQPVAVAARSNSEVWVVNHLSDSVSILDVSTTPARVTRTLLVGDEPWDVVFGGPEVGGPGGPRQRAFITAARRGPNHPDDPNGNEMTTPGIGRADVWVFDATNLGASLGGVPETIVTGFGDRPRPLAVSPDGSTVYAGVFHSGNQTVSVHEVAVCNGGAARGQCTLANSGDPAAPPVAGNAGDIDPGSGLPILPGGLPAPNVDSVGNPGPETALIVRWNAGAGQWQDELGRNWNGAVGISLPDEDVFAIDANANPPVQSGAFSGVGTILFGMAHHPTNGGVYVAATEAVNEVRFEGPGTLGTTVRGHLHESWVSKLTGPSTVTPRHLNKHIDYSLVPVPAGVKDDSLAQPAALAFSADGSKLYVAAFGSQKVGVFDTAALDADTFVPDSANHVTLSGGGPSGLVVDAAHDRLYVYTRFDSAISVVDLTSETETASVPLHNPESDLILNGRSFLYDALATSSNGETSCASCHVFGDRDQLAWDLGNPSGVEIPDPNPFVEPPPSLTFHPLKGPMMTQTLRGLEHHGPMHWRGDRTAAGTLTGHLDTVAAFEQFNGAFDSLMGRDEGPLTALEMNRFARFALTIKPPPNPLRNIDDSDTATQAIGRATFMNEFVAGPTTTCNSCHELDPTKGLFGTDTFSTNDQGPQNFKIPELRNMYDRIGGFFVTANNPLGNGGAAHGDQIKGYGSFHDGTLGSVGDFLSLAFVFPGGPAQRDAVTDFVLAFPGDLAPAVGQQATLTNSSGPDVDARIDLLRTAAMTPYSTVDHPGGKACDLIVKGNLAGDYRGWVLDAASGDYRADRVAEPLITDAALRAQAATSGQELTFTCVAPGSGTRLGVDRDGDGAFDRDELDLGTDPADPASGFGQCKDGLDNDGDTLIDLADPGCGGDPDAASESPECNDGIDNDGDGDIDLLDAACPSPDWDREFAQCDDGLDNDNDGDIDLADAQCKTPWTNRESSTCGIGFEIALLLPPIMALRRRRRRA